MRTFSPIFTRNSAKVGLSVRSFCGFRAAKDLPPRSLLSKFRPIISEAVPTIDLPDDELAAVTAALRGVIEGDRYPRAPRLDALRAALARLDAAAEPASLSKAAPPAQADKRARSAKVPAPKISPGFKLGRLPPDGRQA